MKLQYRLLALAAVLSFGASLASAQVELSFGYGATANRLTLRDNGQQAVAFDSRGFTRVAGTMTATYRPSAQYGIRAVGTFGSRAVNAALVGPQAQIIKPSANFYDLGLEVAYYPSPWWSVGVGGGYASNNLRRFFGSPPSNPTFIRQLTLLAPQDFGFATLALEYYAGIVTFRVAPNLSIGRVYSEGLVSTNSNGQPLPNPQGAWLGINATLMVRAPFGRTEYGPDISFDSLLNRVTTPVTSRLPGWSFGPYGQIESTGLTVESKLNTYSAQPTRIRAGALATYRLNDNWDLRVSAGYASLGWSTTLDSLQQTLVAQTSYRSEGFDLLLGAERKLWRNIYIGAEAGPMVVTSRREPSSGSSLFTSTAPLAAQAPLADVILFGQGSLTWRAGPRLRVGGHLSYTLSNPNGKEVDTRVDPPLRRDERWFGVGVHAGWMIVRG